MQQYNRAKEHEFGEKLREETTLEQEPSFFSNPNFNLKAYQKLMAVIEDRKYVGQEIEIMMNKEFLS